MGASIAKASSVDRSQKPRRVSAMSACTVVQTKRVKTVGAKTQSPHNNHGSQKYNEVSPVRAEEGGLANLTEASIGEK